MLPSRLVTPLMTCAGSGSVEAVRLLIARGADVNAKEPSQNQSALMWAAAEHHADVVRLLVEAGADLQAHTKKGFTAIHFAAREGDLATTRELLSAGVNINIRSPQDGTAAATSEVARTGRSVSGAATAFRVRHEALPIRRLSPREARRCSWRPCAACAARAVPARARRGSQCPRCRLHPVALGVG